MYTEILVFFFETMQRNSNDNAFSAHKHNNNDRETNKPEKIASKCVFFFFFNSFHVAYN